MHLLFIYALPFAFFKNYYISKITRGGRSGTTTEGSERRRWCHSISPMAPHDLKQFQVYTEDIVRYNKPVFQGGSFFRVDLS